MYLPDAETRDRNGQKRSQPVKIPKVPFFDYRYHSLTSPNVLIHCGDRTFRGAARLCYYIRIRRRQRNTAVAFYQICIINALDRRCRKTAAEPDVLDEAYDGDLGRKS